MVSAGAEMLRRSSLTYLIFHLGWLGWLGAGWSGRWVTIWHLVLTVGWAPYLPHVVPEASLCSTAARPLIGWLVSQSTGGGVVGSFKGLSLELANITSAVFLCLKRVTYQPRFSWKRGCTKARTSGNAVSHVMCSVAPTASCAEALLCCITRT